MPIYTNRFDFFFYISAAEKKMRAFKKIIVGKTFFRSAVKAEKLGRKDGTIASQLFFFHYCERKRLLCVAESEGNGCTSHKITLQQSSPLTPRFALKSEKL